MAEKLMQYYKYVKDAMVKDGKGTGQIELAIMTKVPTTKAALAPDSADNLKLFMQAVEKITGKPAPRY